MSKYQMRSLVIIGKRWFQRGPGNTYFSAHALIDGQQVGRIDYAYGYGSQYEWEMFSKLAHDGLLPTPVESAHESPSRYCARNGIAYATDVTDVQRKKDL